MSKFKIENVTYADGKTVAAVGDEIEITSKNAQGETVVTKAILVAANGEIANDNGRIVPLSQIFALPVVNITAAKLVRRAETPKAEKTEEKPPVDGEGLRFDGPTLVEWVERGYDPAKYPPKGYAAKVTSDPKELKIREEMELAKKNPQQ